MEEQAKMERLLRTLMLLSSGIKYTKKEIQERVGVSERSFFRYMKTIEDAGFVLERDKGQYSMQKNDHARQLNRLMHFTDEEALIFYQTLDLLKVPDPRKEPLLRKLNALYDFRALANALQKKTFENISLLTEAITCQRRVRLTNYRSSNSETIRDRIVEPVEFNAGYYDITCIDTEDGRCKQFKVERIGTVTLLDRCCQHASEKETFTDAFRITASTPIATVTAELNIRAYNLLTEEFPATRNSIRAIDKQLYELKIPVASFEGIGRFILGLPGCVHVLAPQSLIDFLHLKVRNHSFCKSVFSENSQESVIS